MLGGTFCYQKKHTKTHTFSNKVAKMSYLKTPFKKIATKMKKKNLSHPKPELKQRPWKRERWCKIREYKFHLFLIIQSKRPTPSQPQCLQKRSKKNMHDHYTPTISSDKVEQLKKKKGNKLLHLEVKVSKHQFKQVSKTMHDTETDSLIGLVQRKKPTMFR